MSGSLGRDLLGERVVGHQAVDERRDGHAADRELCGLIEKGALGHLPMDITVEEFEQFGIEICWLSFVPWPVSPLITFFDVILTDVDARAMTITA